MFPTWPILVGFWEFPFQLYVLGLIRYSRHNRPPERRLPEDPEILEFLPVELLRQLEIPVLAFKETEIDDIHRA